MLKENTKNAWVSREPRMLGGKKTCYLSLMCWCAEVCFSRTVTRYFIFLVQQDEAPFLTHGAAIPSAPRLCWWTALITSDGRQCRAMMGRNLGINTCSIFTCILPQPTSSISLISPSSHTFLIHLLFPPPPPPPLPPLPL